MEDLILFFDSPGVTLETTGGKGVNLSRLAQAGFPVPPGFLVTTAAYQLFDRANGLGPRILTLWRSADADAPQVLEAVSQAIRQHFHEATMPAHIAAAIRQAHANLCVAVGETLPLAVRSSATAEDLPGASFAGQQETFLNVRGAEELLDAVKRCWSSLWTARAIAYRVRQGIAPDTVSLAVIVQQMVPAEAAGILFTANPITGARGEVVIDAAWGLGEAIVGGLVTPDHVVADKGSGQVKEIAVTDKLVMTVPAGTGTEERPVPAHRQSAPVLSRKQVAHLVELGCAIEAHYGEPQDIEWCLADGRLYVVQSRPITALPPEPACWEPPGPGRWVRGGGIMELVMEPISPLMATFLVPLLDQTTREFTRRLGLDDMFAWPMVCCVNGFGYIRVELHPRPRHVLGLIRDLQEHRRSIERWPQALQQYRDAVAELGRPDPAERPALEIYERVEALVRAGGHYWNHVGMVVRLVLSRENRFRKAYDALRCPGDPEPEILLRGQEMRPLDAERSVYALAQTARELPGVADVLAAPDGDVQTACAGTAPGRQFLQRLQAHLDEFGYQIFSLDPLLPTLVDDPQPVLMAVRAYLDGEESPDERQRRMAGDRAAALAAIKARLGGRQRRRFRKLLAEAQETTRLREEALFEMGLAWRPLRRYLLELGRRVTAAGALAAADDVFWLAGDELQTAAADLDAGRTLHPLQSKIQSRQADWRRGQALQPPPILPVGSKPRWWWKHVFPVPEVTEQVTADALVGLGVSPGQVTAVARVIDGPEEMARLNRGEVLVTHTTTPAWTPLFSYAAALVTDLGGALAHGSIVAREYGIPAVMGTGSATRRIQDGQVVTVDGTAGRVYWASADP